MKKLDNIDDVRNSIIISLATCGGIITDVNKSTVNLRVTFQNTDKQNPEKDIFNTFIISRKLLWELINESAELHTQIEDMVDEEEMKKRDEDKKKSEEHDKKEAERKKKAKETRDSKKKKTEDKPKDKSYDNTSDLLMDEYGPYDVPMIPGTSDFPEPEDLPDIL